MLDIGAVILAGGEGRRIGGNKPGRLFRGRTLLSFPVELARSWCVPAALSLHAPGLIHEDGFDIVIDRGGVAGPLAGVLAGLDWAEARGLAAIVTLPCDMPFLPPELLTVLIAACPAIDRPASAWTGDQVHPVCALWPVVVKPALELYAASGKRSLQGALQATDARQSVWDDRGQLLFANINTAGELERMQDWDRRRADAPEGA